jgi:hypothetical protein
MSELSRHVSGSCPRAVPKFGYCVLLSHQILPRFTGAQDQNLNFVGHFLGIECLIFMGFIEPNNGCSTLFIQYHA